MELRDYLRAVRKRWWLLVAAVTVALGAAMLVTNLTPPKYAGSVTFFTSAQTQGGVSDAYQGDLFSQQRVTSYVDLLTSDRLATMVVNNHRIGLTPQQVQRRISAQAIPNTVLLSATVTDGDRAQALRITEALAIEFAALVQIIETPPGATGPTARIEVIAGPKLAPKPVAPTPLRNAGFALVLGVLVGVGAAALREALDTTVKNAETLSQATAHPVLSSIPLDGRAKKAPLIIEGSARSARAEAMRQLRTNLRYVDVDTPVKTIAVSSALPGEGKSTTACNLAIVFAEAGKRVILVDADLRRPSVAEYLGLEGAVGLTNVLVGQCWLDSAVQQWGTSGIFVLPSGSVPPNPSELLGSRNMAHLIDVLRNAFDVVIIDTPPLLPVTDAAIVASIADGAVLVTRCAKTTASQAASASAALAKVEARVLGCVLNMQPVRGRMSYTYYDYGLRPAARHSRRSVAVSPGGPVARPAADVANSNDVTEVHALLPEPVSEAMGPGVPVSDPPTDELPVVQAAAAAPGEAEAAKAAPSPNGRGKGTPTPNDGPAAGGESGTEPTNGKRPSGAIGTAKVKIW
jgi:capsular exopolysaccharide synthesis family protein